MNVFPSPYYSNHEWNYNQSMRTQVPMNGMRTEENNMTSPMQTFPTYLFTPSPSLNTSLENTFVNTNIPNPNGSNNMGNGLGGGINNLEQLTMSGMPGMISDHFTMQPNEKESNNINSMMKMSGEFMSGSKEDNINPMAMPKFSTYPNYYVDNQFMNSYDNMQYQYQYNNYPQYNYPTQPYYYYPYTMPQTAIKETIKPPNINDNEEKSMTSRFPMETVKLFTDTFQVDKKPSKERIKEIAQLTNLTEKQVSSWFSRERRKIKEIETKNIKMVEEDPVIEKLTKLKNQAGGITIDKVPQFNELIHQSSDIKKRKRMLNTLLKSETDVLLELAEKYETLTYLHHWLIKATEGKIVVKYITHILKVLSRFPISFELLRKTSIGMTIGKLSKKKLLDPEKKLLDPGIIKISKELIKSWKQDIKQKKI